MAAVKKQDSNSVGYRLAKEASIGVLPGTPTWIQVEPNEGGDIGANYNLVSRDPINSSRQRKKGTIVDVDATVQFPQDVTLTNLTDLFSSYCFAAIRNKNTPVTISAVNGAGVYTMSNTTNIVVGSLVFCAGFATAANNGLKVVTAVSASTSITVSGTTVIETPPSTATVTAVGYRAQTGAELKIDASGVYPQLTSTATNLNTLGLIPGEFIFIGGDSATNQFANAANNGFKRVKSVAGGAIVLDKSITTMVTDTASGKSVDIYFGKVVKNEDSTLIVRTSYQLERTLGAPDDSNLSQIQSEYVVGCVPNELTLNMKTADKITADFKFVSLYSEYRTGVQGVKSGLRPTLVDRDAINTANDTEIALLTATPTSSANPTNLLSFFTDVSVTINNGLKPNKAVGVLGAFDVSAGTFMVDVKLSGYFNDIALQTAIKNNTDVTFAIGYTKANMGIVFDFPVIALGDGKIEVKKDEPINVPLSLAAAAGTKYDTNMNHTIMGMFYDYLPNLAIS